jgi:hypothetical protein
MDFFNFNPVVAKHTCIGVLSADKDYKVFRYSGIQVFRYSTIEYLSTTG